MEYVLEKASTVNIAIYSLDGQVQQIVSDNEPQEAGRYTPQINTSNLLPGIYLVKAQIGYEQISLKLIKM